MTLIAPLHRVTPSPCLPTIGFPSGEAGGSTHCQMGDFFAVDDLQHVAPIPEPTTLLMIGTSLIGLAAVGRKKFFK